MMKRKALAVLVLAALISTGGGTDVLGAEQTVTRTISSDMDYGNDDVTVTASPGILNQYIGGNITLSTTGDVHFKGTTGIRASSSQAGVNSSTITVTAKNIYFDRNSKEGIAFWSRGPAVVLNGNVHFEGQPRYTVNCGGTNNSLTVNGDITAENAFFELQQGIKIAADNITVSGVDVTNSDQYFGHAGFLVMRGTLHVGDNAERTNGRLSVTNIKGKPDGVNDLLGGVLFGTADASVKDIYVDGVEQISSGNGFTTGLFNFATNLNTETISISNIKATDSEAEGIYNVSRRNPALMNGVRTIGISDISSSQNDAYGFRNEQAGLNYTDDDSGPAVEELSVKNVTAGGTAYGYFDLASMSKIDTLDIGNIQGTNGSGGIGAYGAFFMADKDGINSGKADIKHLSITGVSATDGKAIGLYGSAYPDENALIENELTLQSATIQMDANSTAYQGTNEEDPDAVKNFAIYNDSGSTMNLNQAGGTYAIYGNILADGSMAGSVLHIGNGEGGTSAIIHGDAYAVGGGKLTLALNGDTPYRGGLEAVSDINKRSEISLTGTKTIDARSGKDSPFALLAKGNAAITVGPLSNVYGDIRAKGTTDYQGSVSMGSLTDGYLTGNLHAEHGSISIPALDHMHVAGNVSTGADGQISLGHLKESTVKGDFLADGGSIKAEATHTLMESNLTASNGGAIKLTLHDGSKLEGKADNRNGGCIDVTLESGSVWYMTDTSYVNELHNPSGAVIDMHERENNKSLALHVNSYNKKHGLIHMKTDLQNEKNRDVMVINDAEEGAAGAVYVHDKSLETGGEVTGEKAERLIIDRSSKARFYGQTLNRGGLWDVTPTIEARQTTQADLDSVGTVAAASASEPVAQRAPRRLLAAAPQAAVSTLGAPAAAPLGTTWWLTKYVKELNKDTRPLLDSAGSIYGLYRHSVDTLRQRLGDIRERGITPGEPNFWVRDRGGRFEGGAFDTKYNFFQGGMDFAYGDKAMYGFLVERGIATSHFDIGSGKDHTLSGGLYSTWLSNNGSYTDVVAKVGRHHMDVKTGAAYPDHGRFDEKEMSLSVEYGRTLALDDAGTFLEPQVQFVHGRLGKISYTTRRGTRIHMDGFNSDIGRLGFVIGKKRTDVAHPFSFYAKASILREFGDDRDISLRAANGETMTGSTNYKDTWYEAGFGATCQISDTTYFYVDVERSFSDMFQKKWQVNGGVSWKF